MKASATLGALVGFLIGTSQSIADSPVLPLSFLKATEFYIPTNQVRMYENTPIYFGANVPVPWGTPTPNVWIQVDLKPWGVTADAKGAYLTGELIITHGTTVETADLHLTARKTGDTTADCTKLISQAVEASVGNGQRSGASFWVPLTNGTFEWCWNGSTGGVWPTNSAYGANLTLNAWVR